MAGFVGGGVLGATGNPVLAGTAGGAFYGLLDGVAHTDPQGSFADNGLLVLQGMAIGGMSGGMGGLAGAGMAGALSGTGLSMATQALLTGAAAGIYGGSTARVLSGNGITPAAVTQDALLGGVSGLITYGAASVYRQATAPKPSTTSLQERANLAAQMGEAEGCEGGSGVYTAPNGGGGVTSAIRVNGQLVTFGHGGRHLEGTSLNINMVNQAMANEISTLNLGVGQVYKGQIVVDEIIIEYTSYGVSEGVINIGTYYPIK